MENKEKRSKQLVFNYVFNNDKCIDRNILENDCEFMKSVLNTTRNKKYYDMASFELKTDYEFANYVIDLFKNDHEFILNVIDTYIVKRDFYDVYCINLLLKVSNILINSSDKEKYRSEIVFLRSKIVEFYTDIKHRLNTVVSDSSDDRLGKGFYVINGTYEFSDELVTYIADKMIDEIFFKNPQYTFSEIMHKRFKNYKDLEKYGLKKFFIDYISLEDTYLSQYTADNIKLLDKVLNELHTVEGKWKIYNNWVLRKKKLLSYTFIEKICNDDNYVYCLSAFVEVIRRLNLEKYYINDKYYQAIVDNSLEKRPNIIYLEQRRLEDIILNYIVSLYSSNIIEKDLLDAKVKKRK